MPTRVLSIQVAAVAALPDEDTMQLDVAYRVGISDDDPISDVTTVELSLHTLGVYKTSIGLNAAIADAVKEFVYSEHSIPTNGYAAVYVAGGFGLLSVL